MQRGVVLDRVVDVVGGHGGQAQLVGEQVEGAELRGRVGQQLVLQLDEEVAAEDVAKDGGRGARALGVAGEEARPDLAAAAGREGDEVTAVLGQRLEAGQRRLAGVLEVGGADDAAEVGPAGVVAGEEHEVVAAGAPGGGRRHRGGALEVGDAAGVAVGRCGGVRAGRCGGGARGGPLRCFRLTSSVFRPPRAPPRSLRALRRPPSATRPAGGGHAAPAAAGAASEDPAGRAGCAAPGRRGRPSRPTAGSTVSSTPTIGLMPAALQAW